MVIVLVCCAVAVALPLLALAQHDVFMAAVRSLERQAREAPADPCDSLWIADLEDASAAAGRCRGLREGRRASGGEGERGRADPFDPGADRR